MSIKELIMSDIKVAMKSRDTDRLRVLRSLKSKIMEKEISERTAGEATLSDDQTLDVLMKAVKQRRESIDQFEKGEREDLAARERAELEIIGKYLPEMLSEEEVRKVVRSKISALEASGMSDMGKVMGAAMSELKGKAEGAVVSRVVKEELSD